MTTVEAPIPSNFAEWVWLGIGINFGRAFGKQLDQEVQATTWFAKRSVGSKWLLRRLLDALHHWWIGALLMLYFSSIPEIYWLGVGLFVDDLPDIPRRAQEIWSEMKTLAGKKNAKGAEV